MEDTLGRDSRGQTPSIRSFSLISQAKREPFLSLYSRILVMTAGVDTRGLLPPVGATKIENKDVYNFETYQWLLEEWIQFLRIEPIFY